MHKLDTAKNAIIRVGDGRGFIIADKAWFSALVITAAHCLPFLPPACSAMSLDEKTYGKLLGPLGAAPSVYAECLFVDPVADIAVLGSPDNQELFKQAEAYEALTADHALTLSEARDEETAWLYMLDGSWEQVTAKHRSGPLWLEAKPDCILPGMSGSPILTDDGAAVGVVAIGTNNTEMNGPHPYLPYHHENRKNRNLGECCKVCSTKVLKTMHC
jgi:hypothetical protein